jgi:outer membrane protein assembly factor BamB
MHLLVLVGCYLLLAWAQAVPAVTDPGADTFAAELRKQGIEPHPQGLEKFLTSLRLTPEREAHIRRLLTDLGNDHFRIREQSTAELIALPYVPRRLLEQATARDPETRSRVECILVPRYARGEGKVLLVLNAIERRRLPGFAPLVLELMPQWEESYLAEASARAVAASAERRDGKALREVIARRRSAHARAAAIGALAAVFGLEAEKDLEVLLADGDPQARLAAALALLNQGKRSPLPVLIRLLEAERAEVRLAAAALLQAVTGNQIADSADDDPELRAKAVTAWRAWLAREGAHVRLRVPVRPGPPVRGRIVLAFGDSVLREIDLATAKVVFEASSFRYAWGCHVTPEGHRLAVDYQGNVVVEYDGQGKECWRQKVPGSPTGVERLADGRTLVALAEPGLVVELDRSGKVVWQVRLAGRPTTAQRLANGRTLVSLQHAGKVVENNRRGDVLWEVAGLNEPHTAQRLSNGNVLVCEMGAGAAVEYDRAGKVVWAKRGLNNPAQAHRLANGNTLVSSQNGVTEFSPKGNVVRHLSLARARFFAY